MKTIVAVIFFGIFTYALGKFTTISNCQTATAMSGFDADKFFRGKWYMTNVMNGLFSIVCQELETTKDGNQLYIDYSYKEKGDDNYVRCESKGQKKNGPIPFNCEVKKGGLFSFFKRSKKFNADFTIMDTDYDNYALFYKCVTTQLGHKADNYVLLNRDKNDHKIPGKAKSLLDINNVSLKDCSKLVQADDIISEVV